MEEAKHEQGSELRDQARSEPPLIEATNLSKRFGDILVLDGVSLRLDAGEVLALVGENGAGKSTLVKILAGVHVQYEGSFRVAGKPAQFRSVLDAERAGIAIIHQELNLVRELTVAENIFLGREPLIGGLIVDRRAMTAAAQKLLGRLGIGVDPEAKAGSLRIGEQQIVEIAKALSLDARILIMDEPTSALSLAECKRLFGIVRQLIAAGVAIVFISHRMDEVFEIAHRVMVLRDGRHVLTAPIAGVSREQIIAAMVGRAFKPLERSAKSGADAVVLSVEDLTLDVPSRQGKKRVVDHVSFDVRAGEVFGIAGLLGSGRTEILETIFGASRGERSGRVAIAGHIIDLSDPRAAKAHGIGFVPEDRKAKGLIVGQSILANVVLPSLQALARFGLRDFARETQSAAASIRELRVRCTGASQIVGALSGGNQQKIVIAKWLATNPRILLLDEPTRGIDVGAKQEIYDLIFRLAARGLAIVVVSSEMPEILALADRILVMCEGRATGLLTRAEASEERIMDLASPRMRAAPQGLAA